MKSGIDNVCHRSVAIDADMPLRHDWRQTPTDRNAKYLSSFPLCPPCPPCEI
jgi:hypothetical protein